MKRPAQRADKHQDIYVPDLDYVQQGKWIDYLAERVPAYSKYKRAAAE